MARTRTLANLRTDVADRADITTSSSGRFTDAKLTRYINQAIQAFVVMVSEAGHEQYLKRASQTTSSSSTKDANNWAPREYLTLPSDFYALKGIDITTGSQTVAMMPLEREERNFFREWPGWLSGNATGIPVLYRLGGNAHPSSVDVPVVGIFPFADGAYATEIWYVPEVTDLSSDSDTFDGIAGFEEWIVNKAAMDARKKDGLIDGLYQVLAAENVELERKIRFAMATRGGGAVRKVDTRAQRAQLVAFSQGGWLG